MRKKWVAACAMLAMMLVMSPVSIAEPRHPQIRAALESLRNAREHLEHAAHDFGGHRADAIRSIDEAIHQLEICMKYD
jgi:hypothetical protein